MKGRIIFISLICFLILSCGCTSKQYLDKPTPPGTVESVSSSDLPNAPDVESSPADIYRKLNKPNKDIKNSEKTFNDNTSILKEFSLLYEKNGSPEITIFFNRHLSNEIKEWHSNTRFIATGKGSYKIADKNSSKMNAESDMDIISRRANLKRNDKLFYTDDHKKEVDVEVLNGSLVLKVQRKNEFDEKRSDVVEANMWEIESSFLEPFFKAGAVIIDRSTIMRLMANDRKINEIAEVQEKNIEISALKKYSDIFIELLVNNEGDKYIFKAVAKEIETGRILAIAKAPGSDHKNSKESISYKATTSGYQRIDGDERDIKVVVGNLGLDLIKSLINTWKLN